MHSIRQHWERLGSWLTVQGGSLREDLNPPASKAQLADFERALGLAVPPAYSECLQCHDGQRGQAEWLFDGKEFLSIRTCLMAWSAWNKLRADGDFAGRVPKPAAGIVAEWWLAQWIPFASNGGGDYLCLDMRPGPGGRMGQVIAVFHDLPDRTLVAPSFTHWFGHFVDSKISQVSG